MWRAAVYYELGKPQKAMADLNIAVNLKADEISLFWRGLHHLGLKDFIKAKYDLKAAMKEAEKPIHSRIPFWLGVVLCLTGEKEVLAYN